MSPAGSTFDLVVRGGSVGGERLDVGIVGGVVGEVGPELAPGASELDARGLIVLPGVVDAHVHLNDPGRAHWEGFDTGTRALAAGGTTCAADMPLNSHPPTLDARSLAAKVAAAQGRLHVDVALWGGLVPGNLAHLEALAAGGVVGFKAFTCPSGIDEFPPADDETLGDGMRRAAALGLPVAVHAESPAVLARAERTARAGGAHGWEAYLESRPIEAELEAIARVLALAAETRCALHVVHVTCVAGVELIATARARGVDVTCETCPHYLLLDEGALATLGALAKCAPPLRAPGEPEALRGALAAGAVDTVGSDHSPAPPELKQPPGDDAFASWGGIAGAQTLLVSLLGLDLPAGAIARLAAATPASRLGLSTKGRIAPGADADLALVRPGPWTLSRADLHDRHRASPFVGSTFAGRVVCTVLRGTVAWDGSGFGQPTGRIVRPSAR